MSPPLRSYTPRDLTRACENKLEISFSGSKHRSGWYRLGQRRLFRIIIPKSHRDWGVKTKAHILRQTKLTPDEFDELVRCPMTGPQFEARAREVFNLP